MKNLINLTIGLCCFVLVNSQRQINQSDKDTCTTPSGTPGTCIPIKTCQLIVDTLVNAPRPLPPAVANNLREYHCGFVNSDPKVCCPLSSPPIIDRTSEPPDVSGHRNLGLINGDKCGPFTDQKIISYGGNKTDPFEFPWMALIAHQTGTEVDFRCGGTLINQHYILTAAHCITNLDGSTLFGVRLGEHDISKDIDCSRYDPKDCAPPVQDYKIAEIIPHPQYDPEKRINDIGMLRLSEPANMDVDSVRPICLPTGELRKKSLVGMVYVAGWGTTETGFTSPDLLKVLLPVVSNDDCQRRYNSIRTQVTIGPQQLCAGGIPGIAPCSGDSGGPLKWINFNNDPRVVQYGIVSFGPKFCGETNLPGVYTRTAFYMEWILDNMKP